MLSTVEVEGNQLKLGIRPKDTAGSQRLQFMAESPAPSSSLGPWSILQCYSVSLFFLLCTPASMFTGSFVLAAPKGMALPSWVTHPLVSNYSFSGKGNWLAGFLRDPILLSGEKRVGEGPLLQKLSSYLCRTLGHKISIQHWSRSLVLRDSSFSLFHLFHLLSPLLPKKPWALGTLNIFHTDTSKASSAIEINPRFLKVWRKCWGEKSPTWILSRMVKQRCGILRCHLPKRSMSKDKLKQGRDTPLNPWRKSGKKAGKFA